MAETIHQYHLDCKLELLDGTRFFSTKDKKPKTHFCVSRFVLDGLDKNFLEHLKEVSPLNVREDEINNFDVRFNRHEVLHGSSTDYDTEINSLKSIALLDFFSGFIYRVKNDSVTDKNHAMDSVDKQNPSSTRI
jgi:hypothetical protein